VFVYGLVVLVFALASGAALVLPTLRALRADPLVALRHE